MVLLRSFCLIKKNQKIKAYTPAATNEGVPLKSRKTRFAQTPRFLYAPHPHLLYAAFVRPTSLSRFALVLLFVFLFRMTAVS